MPSCKVCGNWITETEAILNGTVGKRICYVCLLEQQTNKKKNES